MRLKPNLSKRAVVTAMVATSLAAAVGSSALASDSKVVRPGGHVAGRNYSQWLQKWWQVRLRTPINGSICQQVGRVEVLIGGPFPPGPKHCAVESGHAVYVNGPSAECSTVEKGSRGDSDRQLKRCARHVFRNAISAPKVEVDGRPLAHLGRWVVGTRAYRFHLPKRNILGSNRRHGRSAAYGEGFLLKHLSPGLHIVKQSGKQDGQRVGFTYRIRVKG